METDVHANWMRNKVLKNILTCSFDRWRNSALLNLFFCSGPIYFPIFLKLIHFFVQTKTPFPKGTLNGSRKNELSLESGADFTHFGCLVSASFFAFHFEPKFGSNLEPTTHPKSIKINICEVCMCIKLASRRGDRFERDRELCF